MKNLAIARRYAKALLMIGQEDGRVDIYREELDGFAGLMLREENLFQAVTNPLHVTEKRRSVLQEVIKKLNISEVMTSFLMLLFDKGRISFIHDINTFFQKFADELKGVARASLLSATELTDDTVEKIRSALAKRTGKDIILDVEQDPSLIGGIVTKIGDVVLDGSIKTQLLNLQESSKKGERV